MIYTEVQLREKILKMIDDFENEVVEFKEANLNYSFNDIGKYFYLSGWKLGSSRIGRNHAFI